MHRSASRPHGIRIALATALVGTLLSGCSTAGGPLGVLRNPTKAAIVQNETIGLAEAAVLGTPMDGALRARLGSAYLSAGRFGSASTILSDAAALGDTAPTTTLRLALALTGSGRSDEAAALLFDRAEELPAADLGLGLALAGEVQPAIRFMEAAIRDGENNAALRQNLALTYALAGRWRQARLTAGVDVPASALGARMERWAALVTGDTRQRLAMVLRVPAGVADAGVPLELALASAPVREVAQARVSSHVPSAARAKSVVPVPPTEIDADEAQVPVASADTTAAQSMLVEPVAAVEPVVKSEVAEPEIPRVVASAAAEKVRALPAYLRRQHRAAGARW